MSTAKSHFGINAFDQKVGEIVTFIGLKGLMKVRPSSNNGSLFLDIENVMLKLVENNGPLLEPIRATVKEVKLIKNFLHLQLNEFNSRTDVEKLRGAQIYTNKVELRELSTNEWWVSDLIGLQVYTTAGKLIGTVCDAPGEHGEFLEIKKVDNKTNETVIVSFVKELFPVVDLKSKRIEAVDLPGLFE